MIPNPGSAAAACEITTLLEAWLKWWAGSKLDDNCLWGLKVLWWARVGKITTTFSGLVILVDIFGEELINKFGSDTYDTLSKRWITNTAAIVLTLGIASVGYIYYVVTSLYRTTVAPAIAADDGSVMGSIGPLLFIGAMILVGGILAIITIPSCIVLFIIVVSRCLTYPRIGTAMRVASLVLLCLGFHFDLLGS